jgi:hypothetical protein
MSNVTAMLTDIGTSNLSQRQKKEFERRGLLVIARGHWIEALEDEIEVLKADKAQLQIQVNRANIAIGALSKTLT